MRGREQEKAPWAEGGDWNHVVIVLGPFDILYMYATICKTSIVPSDWSLYAMRHPRVTEVIV